jgi:protein-glutamine gamma-glutamyltransferase
MSQAAAAIARRVPGIWASRPSRDLTVPVRVAAFAALAAYVSSAWLAMVVDPPAGRTVLLVAIIAGAAIALSLLGERRLSRPVTHVLAAVVALLAALIGAIALGLPARLAMPWHWDELATNLGLGFGGLWSVEYPYSGSTGWTRLVILLGLPPILALATALAFWPTRAGRAEPRASALIVLLIAYGTATATAPPSDPLLGGLVLLLLLWAWVWLPGQDLRRGLLGGTLILAAGAMVMPIAGVLQGGPLLDYRNWGATQAAGPTESFSWDQAYGPLTWPREGRKMLHVESDGPYYWRAAVLDEFDGLSWVQSDSPGIAPLQLPTRAQGHLGTRLNPDWVHDLTFTIDRLRSDLVVAAGTPLAPPRLDGLTVMERGMLLPSGAELEEGDSYEVRSYIPDPTQAQMRHAPTRYPADLARETEISLPGGRSAAVPLWGSAAGRTADPALAGSAYGGVYELARRITADKATAYGAVKAIETYLGDHYTYSEFAPIERLALRDFILTTHRGYCQHFSGAMALMLRMLGIPARVAAGFSPGQAESGGDYVVTDFDSHSWVEVYFNRIGWVSFDPTPPGAPARSRTSGLGAPTRAPASSQADLRDRRRTTNGSFESTVHHGPARAASEFLAAPWIWIPLLATVGGGIALVRRRRGSRAPTGPDALLWEVEAALARVRSWDVRGSTLLALERRLEAEAGPGAAAYLAKLRAMRYGPDGEAPPAARQRSLLRRELAAGLGLGARMRALAAIPPWGPARRACKPPFRPVS